MNRFFAVAAAAAATLALAPAVGIAQTPRGYYAATPVATPAKNSLVTRSTIWKCGEGVCVAAKANTRDGIVCELVAREGALNTLFYCKAAAQAPNYGLCCGNMNWSIGY
jgi:uncharacterized low-complexity protein